MINSTMLVYRAPCNNKLNVYRINGKTREVLAKQVGFLTAESVVNSHKAKLEAAGVVVTVNFKNCVAEAFDII